MVHLICMRCNHANEAGAKFCGECGTGLLRRFCRQCHAVNDAASHFCQSCGLALPDSHSPPQPSAPLPLQVPRLTDVAFLDPAEAPAAPVDVVVPLESGKLVQLPAQVPALATEAPASGKREAVRIYRAPILLAAGGALAMAGAVWLWPSSDATQAAQRSMPRSMSAAAVPLAAGVPQPVAASESDVLGRADEALSRADAVTDTAPQPIARIKEAASIGPRRPATETRPAPRAAAPEEATPVARAVARPAAPRPAAPAPACTPQVDALGLCAPGAIPEGR
ncbi:MAG TPA: zinc ribbon domain-containing protein [Burkholderiaceae bacterium]